MPVEVVTNSSGGPANLEAAERRRLLLRLFRYLFHYRFRLTAGLFLALLVSMANLLTLAGFVPIFNALGETGPAKPFTIGTVERVRYDRYSAGQQLPAYERASAQITRFKLHANSLFASRTSGEAILILCAILLPIYLLKMLAMVGTLYLIGTAGLMAVRDLRMELFGKMNDLGIEYYTAQRTGFIMSRIINDVDLVGRSISMEFNEAMTNLFYIITHVALLALISWKMFLITFICVPILMTPVSRFAKRVREAARSQQDRLAHLGAHVQEIISGVRVIRAFAMEGFERRRFGAINNLLFEDTFRGHYYHQVGPALTEFISTIVVIGFLVWGAHEIAAENLSRGLFFAFFFTLIFIMRPLKQVSVMFNLLGDAAVAAARIFDLLDRQPAVKDEPDALPFPGVRTAIEYKDVGFAYSGADVAAVRNVSLVIPRGKTLSLVGSSGAGKSTLVDLLIRFYEPTAGAIEIDGTDLRRFRVADLRRAIGVVTQNVFLFNASIRENIAYGRADIPIERIIETARAANAHDFIVDLSEGYDTPIGERGVMLSGGQRQRIAIARALLRDPPILVFDEATSALDNESEKLIQQAMERLLHDRTVIMIAHRLSTVYRSDEIAVLDHGEVVERGTHAELLENGRQYRRFGEMQFSD